MTVVLSIRRMRGRGDGILNNTWNLRYFLLIGPSFDGLAPGGPVAGPGLGMGGTTWEDSGMHPGEPCVNRDDPPFFSTRAARCAVCKGPGRGARTGLEKKPTVWTDSGRSPTRGGVLWPWRLAVASSVLYL